MRETWKTLQLEVKSYSPENTERGFIIGRLDELMHTVDDIALTLQSMEGSRFAGPYMQEIQAMEKDLTLASEVLDIWSSIQRKWLNLESVFAGSDIHLRIPREAEKFDKLNLIFRKVGIQLRFAHL